jgi:hypothetical protein
MDMAGLGIHGQGHPVLGDPSAKTVGATCLVDELDALVCDDPEGSELLVIKGTFARLICEAPKRSCAIDECIGTSDEGGEGLVDLVPVGVVDRRPDPGVVDLVEGGAPRRGWG